MPREDVICLVASVVKVLGDRLFQVELSNGHRLLAHVSGRNRPPADRLKVIQAGTRVRVELSPFDFSTGRLVAEAGS